MQEKREQEEKQARIREIQLQIADIFLEREAKKAISDPDMIDVVEATRELARDLIEEYNLLTK
jgi:hypothetical protein